MKRGGRFVIIPISYQNSNSKKLEIVHISVNSYLNDLFSIKFGKIRLNIFEFNKMYKKCVNLHIVLNKLVIK